MKASFKTAKWCLKHDKDCEMFSMFNDGKEIDYLNYATRTNFIYVKYKDGSFEDILTTTKLQVE